MGKIMPEFDTFIFLFIFVCLSTLGIGISFLYINRHKLKK